MPLVACQALDLLCAPATDRTLGGSKGHAMGRHDLQAMLASGLAAKGIDHVSTLAPVCITQAALEVMQFTVRCRPVASHQLSSTGVQCLPYFAFHRGGRDLRVFGNRLPSVLHGEVFRRLLGPGAIIEHPAGETLAPSHHDGTWPRG